MDNIIFSNNPMVNGCECIVCVIIDNDNEIQKMEMGNIFRAGQVVAVTDERNLPVYPDIDSIVNDTIEATFNPDIDKTCHFDLGDVDDLYMFKAVLLGDATSTAIKSVYTAKAVLISEPIDMVPIRTEIKLKAAKYGKKVDENNMSARKLQIEKDLDYRANKVMQHVDFDEMFYGQDMSRIEFAEDFSVDLSNVDEEGNIIQIESKDDENSDEENNDANT